LFIHIFYSTTLTDFESGALLLLVLVINLILLCFRRMHLYIYIDSFLMDSKKVAWILEGLIEVV